MSDRIEYGVLKVLSLITQEFGLQFIINRFISSQMALLNNSQENNMDVGLKNSQQDATNSISRHRINTKALLKKKGWNGKWSGREELKYIKFIEQNKDLIEQKQTRKRNKIFMKMSRFIRSRNSDQCRSHHQKLIQYHSDIESIIIYYKTVVFIRWQNILSENKAEVKNKKNSRQICKQSDLKYSISVVGAAVRIEIVSESIPSYSF